MTEFIRMNKEPIDIVQAFKDSGEENITTYVFLSTRSIDEITKAFTAEGYTPQQEFFGVALGEEYHSLDIELYDPRILVSPQEFAKFKPYIGIDDVLSNHKRNSEIVYGCLDNNLVPPATIVAPVFQHFDTPVSEFATIVSLVEPYALLKGNELRLLQHDTVFN